jgi:hypothetical protein
MEVFSGSGGGSLGNYTDKAGKMLLQMARFSVGQDKRKIPETAEDGGDHSVRVKKAGSSSNV